MNHSIYHLRTRTRAKGSNPSDSDRGQVFADILANKFSNTGELVTEASPFRSPKVSYAQLKAQPVPIGVIESYHRVARQGATAQVADIVFTGNPRQPWMNPFISNTTFKTGPQYQVRMRPVSSFNQVMESSPDGKAAYYGATQSSSGGGRTCRFLKFRVRRCYRWRDSSTRIFDDVICSGQSVWQ